MAIKRSNDELKANRPTLNEIKILSRLPIYILLENIRSVHNVGSVFRTIDGIGGSHLYLTGYTAFPPRKDLEKVSLGAEKSVNWSHHNDPISVVKKMQDNNVHIVSLEQTKNSVSIYEYNWKFPICFILGNEVKGISEELLSVVENHVEIPMYGIKQSLNVSVACGVAGYEISRFFINKSKIRSKNF